MPGRLTGFLKHRFVDDRFLFLLISILSLLIISPIIRNFIKLNLLVDIFSTTILLSGIYAASRKKITFRVAITLAIPMLLTTWTGAAIQWRSLMLMNDIFSAIFIGFTALVIFGYLIQIQKITTDAIYGAVVVYLLIGVLWAFLYSFLEILQPGAFQLSKLSSELVEERRFVLFYYSFVTLTTLGYGDITPMSPIAASLAIVEAIFGQVYLAVMIARIVGIHVAQFGHKNSTD